MQGGLGVTVRLLGLVLAFLLGACGSSAPERAASPALWEVAGPDGERGWLFGTIHALPPGLAWRTPALDAALARADPLVLEIADTAAGAAGPRLFLRLAAASTGQPPLPARVRPELRDELAQLVAESGVDAAALARLEDWGAALALAQAMQAQQGLSVGEGVERALLRQAAGRPVVGLETVAGQLAVFDRLEPPAQRALLEAVVAEGADPALGERLVKAWAAGDLAALAREARTGMLADPALRRELLVERNQRWAARIETMLQDGARPFVAVGAAHVAGADGLPALLAERGWTVTRVQ